MAEAAITTPVISSATSAGSSPIGGAETSNGIISSNVASTYYKASEPSVLSDSNVRDNIIPNIQTKANQLIGAPQATKLDANGNAMLTGGTSSGNGTSTTNANDGSNGDITLPPEYADIYKSLTDVANTPIEQDPRYAPSLKIINDARSANDANYNSTLDSITKQYTNLANNMKNAQDSQSRSLAGALRMGGSRYAPVSTGALMDAKFNNDIQSLSDLQDKETQLISSAQTARSNRDYELLGKQLDLINEKRTEKNTLAQKIQGDLVTQNEKIRQDAIQSTRDNAIAGLVNQGITDPAQILDLLNNNDEGQQTGDFTSKEVASALKNISPEGDLAKLSGATRDFFILKGHNQLPSNISSLPDDQQLMEYLKEQKAASTAPGKPSVNKITLTEAKSKGLPLSTVGMSEQDIVDSFQQSDPPHWFTEKLNTEKGTTVLPEVAQTTWDAYRKSFMNTSSTKASKPPASVIGIVRQMRANGEKDDAINQYISYKGYDPADDAFK